MQQQIRFKGNEYLLIGDKNSGGAIATKEQYETFSMSYAHLMINGKIMKAGATIGTIEDIEFISDKELPPAHLKRYNLLKKHVLGLTAKEAFDLYDFSMSNLSTYVSQMKQKYGKEIEITSETYINQDGRKCPCNRYRVIW